MRKNANVDSSLSSCCGAALVKVSELWICPECHRQSPNEYGRRKPPPAIGTTMGARAAPVLNEEIGSDYFEAPYRWQG
jgi:hypothetical protein